jgi:hypothetical protein
MAPFNGFGMGAPSTQPPVQSRAVVSLVVENSESTS